MSSSSVNVATLPSVNWSRTSFRVLSGHTSSVYALGITKDGSRIASIDDDNIRIWNTESATLFREIPMSTEAFFAGNISPDGSRVAAGGQSSKVYVWDAQTGQQVLKLKGHKYWLQHIAFSNDGSKLVTSCEKSVRIWDAKTGDPIRVLEDTASGFRVPLFSEMFTARASIFSPDDSHVASGGTDKVVKVWNVSNGYCDAILEGHTDWVTTLAYSSDGKRIVSGSWDDSTRVWDWEEGTCISSYIGTGTVWAVAISPDGTLVASASKSEITLWKSDTGEVVKKLQGHTKDIRCMDFLPDGTGLVSSGEDKSVRIWKAAANQVDLSEKQSLTLTNSQPEVPPSPTPASNAESQDATALQESATGSTPQVDTMQSSSSSFPTIIPSSLRRVPPPPSSSSIASNQSSETTIPPSTSATSNQFSSTTSPPPPLPPRAVRDLRESAQRVSSLPTSPLTHSSAEPYVASPRSSLSISNMNALVDSGVSTAQNLEGWNPFIPFTRKFTGKYRRRSTEAIAYGGFSDRLQREILVWSRLEHPHIVPLIGFRFEPTTCLISPWYSNGNVKDWVKKHPEVDKRKLMWQSADGLAYLHSMDPPIVHGDIKSDNILIDDEGIPVINDFGLSQIVEEAAPTNTTSTANVGNARWLAPELYLDEDAKRSIATDVYAFGGLLLEIATGALPFRELSDVKVSFALVSGKLPVSDRALYPELPEDDTLWDLMLDCWNPDAEARPTMKEVEGRLQS
ncbi:hypothetical protein FRC03_011108 [Tulasnella sp. 419]|nr:hypothetical protein FRC03_011108 [Tulasnella sp. 419]